MYRVIIVENDLAYLESLKLLMSNVSEINLVQTCSDVESAYLAISELKPDLVFLDIMLDGGTAFDLLAKFRQFEFEIVFTTAYDEYALKAIQLSALHYLLKPYSLIEIQEVLNRMNMRKRNELLVKNLLTNLSQKDHSQHRIALKTTNEIELIELQNVVYCKADNNYTVFHLQGGQKITVSTTIKKFDDLLFQKDFLRVHQSYLVNLRNARKFIKTDGGSILMSDGTNIPVSRRKHDELSKAIERMVL
jgi:two-component system LytT family response regulator